MIFQHVPSGRSRRNEGSYALQVTSYVTTADQEAARALGLLEANAVILSDYATSREKAGHVWSRNLIHDDPKRQSLEMLTATRASRATSSTLEHFVVSWPEGETPSNDQLEEAGEMLLRSMRLERGQAVFGEHVDTKNRHFHAAVNRVDPVSHKILAPPDRLYRLAGHAAIAVIAHRQGWSSPENATFSVDGGKLVHRTGVVVGRADEPGSWQFQKIRNTRDGTQGHPRPDRERALAVDQYKNDMAPGISVANNWKEVIESLKSNSAKLCMSRGGKGASIEIDGHKVKLSEVRSCSFGRLINRLGPVPEGMLDGNRPEDRKIEYLSAREIYLQSARAVANRWRRQTTPILSHGDKGESALRSFRDGLHASVLREAVFPTFEAWQAGERQHQVPDSSSFPAFVFVQQETTDISVPSLSLRYEERGPGRALWMIGGTPGRPPDFYLAGRVVVVPNPKDHEAVRQALLFATRTFRGAPLSVAGPSSFVDLAIRLAAEETVELEPHLQRRVAQTRSLLRQPQTEAAAKGTEEAVELERARASEKSAHSLGGRSRSVRD